MSAIKFCTILIYAILITACGGSGGGNSDSSKGEQNTSGGNQTTSISIDKTSLSFTVDQNQYSEPQFVNATYKGDDIVVGFAPNVTQPYWLEANLLSWTSSTAVVRLAINSQAPIGVSTTSIRFVTAKEDGTQIKTVDLPITVTVNPVIGITSAPYSGNFIYGSSLNSESYQVSITGSNSAWTATSDQSWLQVMTANGTGNGTIETKINSGNLNSGTYTGHLTVVANNNPNKPAVLSYTLNIINPTLSVIQPSILLGGENGLSSAAQDLSFSINTEATSYPYTITLTTEDGKNWLKATKTTGTINASKETNKISADAKDLIGGTYKGKAKVQTTIGSITLSTEIPVTFNKEANRIVVSTTGVAFSSLPNRSLLTRDVKIFSTTGRTDLPWTATSDQSWLTTSSTGLTGDSVTLTASRGSLVPGHIYFANVTIKSSDTSVENQETIRVGFTVSDTATTDVSINTPHTESDADYVSVRPFITASPVEPLIFTNTDSTTIKAYNIYTGVEERSFSGVVAKAGGMSMSGDGLRLYIYDQTNIEVVEVDSTSGELLHKYSASSFGNVSNMTIAYMRPDGRPILVGVGPHIYDISTHADITPQNSYLPGGESVTPATNPQLVVDVTGQLFKLTRSALNGGTLRSELIFSAGTTQGVLGQACLNAQGTRVYTASGAPYNFPGTNIVTRMLEQVLPGNAYPNSILCGWNGLIIGGSNSYYDAEDIFIYNGFTGQNLGNKSSSIYTSYRHLVFRGLALSGDATRLVSISENNSTQNQIKFQSVPSIQ